MLASKLPQVCNEDSICGDLELLAGAEDEGNIALSSTPRASRESTNFGYSTSSNVAIAINFRNGPQEEDLVPDDDHISELSQTFLIEGTKNHITERSYEDSFGGHWNTHTHRHQLQIT